MTIAELSRRKLLKIIGGGACLPVLPASLLQASESRSDHLANRKIVLLELAGANDGLNTVVPFKDHRYTELRPKLALRQSQVIDINSEFALHNALEKLMPLWESGEMAVLHGLGYPQANRSHFKSMEIWETGGDGQSNRHRGWMTHDIEHAYAVKQVDAHGISLGGGMGLFSSPAGNWLSMGSLNQFLGRSDLAGMNAAETASSVTPENPALSLIMQRTRLLRNSMQKISDKIETIPERSKLSGSALALQLSHAANLINAGVDTPVIKVSHGGFDTHENQHGRHRQLLSQFASAVNGFRRELIASGQWSNTLLVTYSEFGRRAGENRSGGTDHGTAAAHFVMGGSVNGGLFGKSPDLGALINDDLQYTMDYRALYSELLSSWLQLPENRFTEFTDDRLSTLVS